ncbi:MAG TPA: DinB family protein [Tepidisphaeraceae bacterium]|jgi:uncharacterized damage-inducible protein DinB
MFDTKSDAELFAAYEQGIGQIGRTVAGLSREQLLAKPVEGKWSTQQVIIHLADAESAFTHRMKRIIAEDRPMFSAWDENRFTERLAYEHQSAQDAATLVDLERRQMVRILNATGLDVLTRTGVHTERGEQTARVVMEYAVWHLSHHLKFVEEKKAKLGL